MIATVLRDRVLLGNGVSVVEPEQVPDLFMRGLRPYQLLVTELTRDIFEFNKRSPEPLNVFTGEESWAYDLSWQLPKEYLELDLEAHFGKLVLALPAELQERALVRVENELAEVKKFQFENGIRTICYVIDTFKRANQVWGVGRGSSCASYLLYLSGVHRVDCLKYNVHYSEFFHD